MKFEIGQRVLVHQVQGISFGEDGTAKMIPHDCSKPEQHWKSRVTGWSDFHECPLIATGRDASCEWPYGEKSLTPLEDGEDWVAKSPVAPGTNVFVKFDFGEWHGRTQVTQAVVTVAHIGPNDWMVTLDVPASDGAQWRRVFNERDMYRTREEAEKGGTE